MCAAIYLAAIPALNGLAGQLKAEIDTFRVELALCAYNRSSIATSTNSLPLYLTSGASAAHQDADVAQSSEDCLRHPTNLSSLGACVLIASCVGPL